MKYRNNVPASKHVPSKKASRLMHRVIAQVVRTARTGVSGKELYHLCEKEDCTPGHIWVEVSTHIYTAHRIRQMFGAEKEQVAVEIEECSQDGRVKGMGIDYFSISRSHAKDAENVIQNFKKRHLDPKEFTA